MFYYLLRLKFYYNSWQIDEWTEKNSSFVRVSMTSFKTSVNLIQLIFLKKKHKKTLRNDLILIIWYMYHLWQDTKLIKSNLELLQIITYKTSVAINKYKKQRINQYTLDKKYKYIYNNSWKLSW